jgi:hypothetical protein
VTGYAYFVALTEKFSKKIVNLKISIIRTSKKRQKICYQYHLDRTKNKKVMIFFVIYFHKHQNEELVVPLLTYIKNRRFGQKTTSKSIPKHKR